MNICICPIKNSVEIKAPSSKSCAHRLLICAALAEKCTEIICENTSADIEATVSCLSSLGAEIQRDGNKYIVDPIKKVNSFCKLGCGESGSTLRFLLPLSLALGHRSEFYMSGRLPSRPLSPLYEELIRHGARLGKQGENPLSAAGKLQNGTYSLAGDISSQFISGLLFALPVTDGDSLINITGKIESRSYINITRQALESFGVKTLFENSIIYIKGNQKFISPGKAAAEGDWSNAAFWLCMGALSDKDITVSGLNFSTLQGDKAILDILRKFGSYVSCEDNSVTVKREELSGITVDASDILDLIPAVAVVAAAANGTTVITNAKRLKYKESDRLNSVAYTLSALGADISETDDGLIIHGKRMLDGGTIDSFGDHRIAMMAATAAQVCKNPVTIINAAAVEKSYPTFWQVYSLLGECTEAAQ